METPQQQDHPRIADHGLIGDLRTAALVATDGTVDWWCVPRFDSPTVFAALLDRDGGHCRIRPARSRAPGRQLYFPDTAVLITRFTTDEGVGEVVDFMPPSPDPATATPRWLVRMVRCVRGRVEFTLDVAPRFDYGRAPHRTTVTDEGALFEGPDTAVVLHTVREPGDTGAAEVRLDGGGDLHAGFTLGTGQVRGIVLEPNPAGPPRALRVAEVERAFRDTARFWHDWLARSTYRGRWREAVDRSAVTLKLLTHAPSGALVAAPTAGLPEQLGGERNWDYRYTWVRDASFAVSSLLDLGFTDEAAAFARWLADRYEEAGTGPGGPLRVLYRVDGSADVPEHVLDHWAGHRGSAPVRIGNAAGDQLQLDVYGELLDALHRAHGRGLRIGHRGWQALRGVLDWLADNWDRPDEGIWETRGGRHDFTYGRVMSWVAFDRGLRLAADQGLPAPVERWREARDLVHDQVWRRGWSPRRRAFTQRYGADVLDASLLRMARAGFVAPHDPAWLATLAAVERDLVVDGQVLRYDPVASPDGLAGAEGTFSLCTFDYVSALARSGRVPEARLLFEKALTHANHLGLHAEEIGPTGEQLGNFPQAFTHLALIDAAITLDGGVAGERSWVPW
ncbi:glycoside hydrolase family 15 protein [Saccharothrix syringae]|uniref:Glycoside hydrolase family 15 protein n=1 Tax=Saccharothrix syringae TaxID=103733 RepID=A0A5Q0H0C2_SACSY|nr:glycoside hydrolase family 15 protein [Saccharothrix syringae]QFZ19648.1 glycoside hydrolase family 15 protein [Saccharothrix syringae]